MSPLVPEFSQKSGRDAFVNNHQMPPFEKADWKGNPDMALETKYGHYEAAFAESAANIAELNAKLLELEPLIYSTECATEVTSYPLGVTRTPQPSPLAPIPNPSLTPTLTQTLILTPTSPSPQP